MTLLIFVRCQDGCILASDRKATPGSGLGQEETKCKILACGVAIAGAGNDASAIQALFTRLDGDPVQVGTAIDAVMKILRVYNTASRIDVECIVLIPQNGTVEAITVRTSGFDVFSHAITSPFHCPGELGPKAIATHYLRKQDYTASPVSDAAPEVLAILNQAAKIGSYVGAQDVYGFDIILLRQNEVCLLPRVVTEYVSVSTEFSRLTSATPSYRFTQFGNGAERS